MAILRTPSAVDAGRVFDTLTPYGSEIARANVWSRRAYAALPEVARDDGLPAGFRRPLSCRRARMRGACRLRRRRQSRSATRSWRPASAPSAKPAPEFVEPRSPAQTSTTSPVGVTAAARAKAADMERGRRGGRDGRRARRERAGHGRRRSARPPTRPRPRAARRPAPSAGADRPVRLQRAMLCRTVSAAHRARA